MNLSLTPRSASSCSLQIRSVGSLPQVPGDILNSCIFTSLDVQALTRVYNQPTTRTSKGRLVGALYKNPVDCLWKTFKSEGIFGWYKGM